MRKNKYHAKKKQKEAVHLLKLVNFIGFSHTKQESFFFVRPA